MSNVPIAYDRIVETLFERVPAFRESRLVRESLPRDSHDLPYVVFGRFASFLNDLIPKVSPSDPTIQASFKLLNEMGNSSEQRVQDLAAIGTFEVLTDSNASIRAARQLLYGRAIDRFEEMIRFWGVEVRDP